MSDPAPAIAEAAATGAIAEIFADIRGVLRVEVVNLIWRHLATLPGALPWVWGVLKPLYANGTILAEAKALRSKLVLPHLPPFPPALLAAVGIVHCDLNAIRNILAAYERTNAMALVALSALLCRLEEQPSPSGAAASDGAESQPDASSLIPLPTLPSLAEMAGPTANLVLILNRLGARRENPILASMYRHLAYWPAYLALSWALIAPLDADGSLDRAIAGVLETARSRAASMAARLYSPPVDATTRASIRSAVEPFAGDVIARMVVICAVLRAATGP
jgi:hypothetical protein